MAKKKSSKIGNAKNVSVPTEHCFVIMPFGSWFNDYYDNIYQPAIEEAGLIAKRADDLYRPSTIVNDIWDYTQKAKLILADLTGKNPNVFYELGLAHALAKPAILITESINDVPFDLRALRVIEYNKNVYDWGSVLKENITKSIKEVAASPLESVLPTFLSVKASSKPKSVTEQDKNYLELRQDVDILLKELRSIRVHSAESYRREIISRSEAEELFERFLKQGYPSEIIIKRLVSRGVPEGWVIEKLNSIGQTALPSENKKSV